MPRDGIKNRKPYKDGLKNCQRCKEWKLPSEYFGDNKRWDRLQPCCKECGRALQRKYPLGMGHKIGAARRRQPYNDRGEKLCSSCGQWKLPALFEKRNDSWDGRRTKCKACLSQQRRERYVKKGRSKRGKYNMTLVGSMAISKAVRARVTGSGNPNWKNGISFGSWRSAPEVQWWRRKVLGRDAETCQRCGTREGRIHAHHIKPAGDYPNLVITIENGTTLCWNCHIAVHKEMRREIV